MTSPFPDEPTAEQWARAEAEYAAREREKNALTIERVLDAHAWRAAEYFCLCGRAMTGADGWGRHILWAALEPDDEP